MFDLLLYLFTVSVSPGPNTIMSFSNATEKGLRKGIYLNYGMLVGIFTITTISFIFVSFLSKLIPDFNTILQIFSIVYILYLSWKMYQKSVNLEERKEGTFRDGFLMQLVNVKVMMLSLTSISSFILPLSYSPFTSYLISLLIPIICFLTGLIWAIAGSFLKKIYKKREKEANIIFALSLLLLAIKNGFTLVKSLF